METGWMNFFSGAATSDYSLGHNSNLTTNTAWNIWDKISTTTATATPTHYDWTIPASSNEQPEESSMVHTLLFNTGVGWNSPDPHMMCLKLGKRHYCDEGSSVVVPNRHVTVESSSTTTKRGKLPPYPYNTAARWPVSTRARVNTSLTRCQVEGCHVALGNAKEYYRRHKVCEIHSKAPNVVVSGFQQRFCQQCSRFHDVTEFDEAKRSCRRRLQGHNMRRRKGILSGSLPRNFPQSHGWGRDLDRYQHYQCYLPHHHHQSRSLHTTMTLDVKQPPALDFGLLAMKVESKGPEEWTDYCWSAFGGANVV
ncbi:hypothetical protein M8C21_012435 [Ambrosia artemisiifolia]|uniref:SBP-type domain-containing protein n=1 Tax=Ambrosia artemisiifolia TaxID=4212 RepID=A0AAD5CWH8_AMBAR|nr:hypothetical protein M8C21_012435 [Ambrosia artemisiifolia]